jgi:hypothetical protein
MVFLSNCVPPNHTSWSKVLSKCFKKGFCVPPTDCSRTGGYNSVENERNEQCRKSQTRILSQINQQLKSLRRDTCYWKRIQFRF